MKYNPGWDKVEEEVITWIAPGLLAEGKLTVLDGDPGLGKTTVWVDWAARITTGRPIAGGEAACPAGVFVFNGEDAVADTLLPRFRLQGGDVKHIGSIDVKPDNTPFLIPNDLMDLEALIEVYNVKLVVLDPVYSFISADMTKSQQVRQALIQFQNVLRKHRCAGLLLRHLNKNSQSSESMYRGEGSIGINATARFVLQTGYHPSEPDLRVIANTKANIGKGTPALTYRIDEVEGEQHGRLSWIGTANLVASDLLQPTNRHDREEREDLWIWAEAQLPVTVKQLEKDARAAGLKIDAVKEVLKAHNIRPKPMGKSGEWEYRRRQTLEDVGVLECVECGAPRFKGQDICPECGNKPVKIVRNQ